MQVTVNGKTLEVSSLAVVQLVANAKNVEDLDIEEGPSGSTIAYKGGVCGGKTLEKACIDFIGRFLV